MPSSKIETALSKATGIKQGAKQDRQAFLNKLALGVQKLDDDAWDKLGTPAQDWSNAAAEAIKAKKAIKDFKDVGAVKPDADDDEDETPRGKAKGKAKAEPEDDDDEEEAEDEEGEDDEEEEAPPPRRGGKGKGKPAAEEADDDDEEEEEEKPARRPAKGKAKAKAEPEDDDDEEEAEDEAPRSRKGAAKKAAKPEGKSRTTPAVSGNVPGTKDKIKDLIFNDPDIDVDTLVKKLGKGGAKVSKVTVSNIRAEYRHTIRFLKSKGAKGLEAKKG